MPTSPAHRLRRRHRARTTATASGATLDGQALPDMVLLHGGGPRGAERIAACWADSRQGAAGRLQACHAKAAPFKRNDKLLETRIGVIVLPGSGISENLADKGARHGGRRVGAPFSVDPRRYNQCYNFQIDITGSTKCQNPAPPWRRWRHPPARSLLRAPDSGGVPTCRHAQQASGWSTTIPGTRQMELAREVMHRSPRRAARTGEDSRRSPGCCVRCDVDEQIAWHGAPQVSTMGWPGTTLSWTATTDNVRIR